jgi:hypothetical protein
MGIKVEARWIVLDGLWFFSDGQLWQSQSIPTIYSTNQQMSFQVSELGLSSMGMLLCFQDEVPHIQQVLGSQDQ